jgi:glutamine synthetase adenylyltransferase
MNKFVLVFQNSNSVFHAKYQNTSPCQFIHTIEISIKENDTLELIIQTHSLPQSELLRKMLAKFNPIECSTEKNLQLNINKDQASETFKILSEKEGFDDFLLCEIQEQLAIQFDWDDSLFIKHIKQLGFDGSTEITAISHPERLFKLGMVMEQRIQDLCDNNLESLLSAINCYAQIGESSAYFIAANEKICHLIESTLQNQKSQEYCRQLYMELVMAYYKLKQYEKATPYLIQLHEIKENNTCDSPKP